jgi:nicotinamidase-related amidase
MDFAVPLGGEAVFQKSVHSAFIGTELEVELRKQGIVHLILAGLTSDHCVSTSARMGADLGFEVSIPYDAVATFDRINRDGIPCEADLVQEIALASLHREFAKISSTREVCQ